MLSQQVRVRLLKHRGVAVAGSSVYSRELNGSCRSMGKFAHPEGKALYEDDYAETPDYPPIDPETRRMPECKKVTRKKRLDWEESFRNSGTIEEKLIQLNMPRRYGWKTNVLKEDRFGYDTSLYYKFITQTYFVPGYQLPDLYSEKELAEKARHYVEKLKEPLRDVLRFEFDGIQRTADENLELEDSEIELNKTHSIVNQVNRLLISTLASETPHLRTCQVDPKPKIEAFWFCGGMEPKPREANFKKYSNSLKYTKPENKRDPNEPLERNFQYMGSPILQLRCVNPIQSYVAAEDDLCKKGDTFPERMRLTAKMMTIDNTVRFATVLNGHWSGDDHRSSILSIHPQSYLNSRHRKTNKYFKEDEQSALDSHAFQCCFGRMIAQAYNFGFDQFTDLDYPFSTQFISTNGLDWSFYAYQLNTIKIAHRDRPKNNKQNLCWGTQRTKIMEGDQLNESVVENLVKFYLNPPVPISSPKGEVAPYLKEKLYSFEDETKREFIFVNFRDMYTQKRLFPENRPLPEIHDWEWIYKIYNKTMPLEARKRFFEYPNGYPGKYPYEEEYILRDPKKIPHGLIFYRKKFEERKEAQELEATKLSQKSRFERKRGSSDESDV